MDPQMAMLIKQVLESQYGLVEKKALLNELRKFGNPENNRWHYRYVILVLALVALSVPVVVIWTLWKGNPVDAPAGLLSLGAAAVGALAAFLTPSSRKNEIELVTNEARLTDQSEKLLPSNNSSQHNEVTSPKKQENNL